MEINWEKVSTKKGGKNFYKVSELRVLLKSHDLDHRGNKPVLVKRLLTLKEINNVHLYLIGRINEYLSLDESDSFIEFTKDRLDFGDYNEFQRKKKNVKESTIEILDLIKLGKRGAEIMEDLRWNGVTYRGKGLDFEKSIEGPYDTIGLFYMGYVPSKDIFISGHDTHLDVEEFKLETEYDYYDSDEELNTFGWVVYEYKPDVEQNFLGFYPGMEGVYDYIENNNLDIIHLLQK